MAELALTVKEAAEALGISERTIYEMVYKNQIPHRRIEARGRRGQGKILIPRAALEKWLMEEEKPLKLAKPKKKVRGGKIDGLQIGLC